jgi:hypothetical protein
MHSTLRIYLNWQHNFLTAINAARKLLRKGFIHEQHIPLAE